MTSSSETSTSMETDDKCQQPVHGHHQLWNCFARQMMERLVHDTPSKSTREMHNDIHEAYPKLNMAQFHTLMMKYEKLSDQCWSEEEERGFWRFFHLLRNVAKDTDPRGLNDHDVYFFNHIYDKWTVMTRSQRVRHVREATQHMNIHPSPPMPKNLPASLKTQQDWFDGNNENGYTARGVSGGVQLQRYATHKSEDMEKCLNKKFSALEDLEKRLSALPEVERLCWEKQIKQIQDHRRCEDAITGVEGDSGAGKSSLINAVIGAALLPSNSRRACTPFAIKVGYWNGGQDACSVRIITHFIDRESWSKEVKGFFTALSNAGRLTERALEREDNDFKSMRDKIRVLCPDLAMKASSQLCPEQLENHPNITGHLGDTKTAYYPKIGAAREALDYLIRGNGTAKYGVTEAKSAPIWPLVKYVEVGIRSGLLSNGITIVDLPGVHDINTARSSVAERQMQECSAVWIVAPLIRAADNAGANSLLTKAFDNSLHLDNLSLVFVGTKSDDIGAPREEAEALDVQSKIDELDQRLAHLQDIISGLAKGEKTLSTELKSAEGNIDRLRQRVATYDVLKFNIEQGVPQVCPPCYQTGQKRKASVAFDSPDTALNGPERGVSPLEQQRKLSSVGELDLFMDIIKSNFEDACTAAKDLAEQHQLVKEQLRSHEKEMSDIEPRMWQICIQARNKASKHDVKESFANALKQFQDDANPENSDGTHAPRLNEEEVEASAESLPVIMVSSKAFEYLRRKQQAMPFIDNQDRGIYESSCLESFTTDEMTGIPELIARCMKQGQDKRKAHYAKLLNKIETFLTSIQLSVLGTTFHPDTTQQELDDTRRKVRSILEDTGEQFDRQVKKSDARFLEVYDKSVLNKFGEACQNGRDNVRTITENFGNSVNSHSTFRAIAKRGGSFKSSGYVSYDLNKMLASPLIEVFGVAWRKLFGETLLELNSSLQLSCRNIASQSKNAVIELAKRLGCSPKTISLIKQQCERHINQLNLASNACIQDIQFAQRAARELLCETIQKELAPAYESVVEITGKGALSSMRSSMKRDVMAASTNMYNTALGNALQAFEAARAKASSAQTAEFKIILGRMQKDYENIFGFSDSGFSQSEIESRRELIAFVESISSDTSCSELWKVEPESTMAWDRHVAVEEGLFVDED